MDGSIATCHRFRLSKCKDIGLAADALTEMLSRVKILDLEWKLVHDYCKELEALIPATTTRSALKVMKKPIPKTGPKRAARLALDALFSKGIPIDESGQELTNAVNNYINRQPSELIEGRVKQTVSLDTVLRAAERK